MAVIRDENGFELFEHDKHTGRTVWRYFDGEKTIYRTDYPVEKTLQQNAQARDIHQGARWGGGRRIASVPLNVYFEQLAEAQNQKDDKYLSKWLNDSDNAAFRTFEGRV